MHLINHDVAGHELVSSGSAGPLDPALLWFDASMAPRRLWTAALGSKHSERSSMAKMIWQRSTWRLHRLGLAFHKGLLPHFPHIYLSLLLHICTMFPHTSLPNLYFCTDDLHAGARLRCMFHPIPVHVHLRMPERRQKMSRHVISVYLGTVWPHVFMSHVIQWMLAGLEHS